MNLKRFTAGAIGELDFPQVNQVWDFVRERQNEPRPRAVEPFSPKLFHFDAIIVSSDTFAPNRWLYAWRQAEKTAQTGTWVEFVGGLTSHADNNNFFYPATNDWEDDNNGSGAEGFGVVVDEPDSTVTIAMLPIPIGKKVTMGYGAAKDGKGFFSFEAPNAFSVTCNQQPPAAQVIPQNQASLIPSGAA